MFPPEVIKEKATAISTRTDYSSATLHTDYLVISQYWFSTLPYLLNILKSCFNMPL